MRQFSPWVTTSLLCAGVSLLSFGCSDSGTDGGAGGAAGAGGSPVEGSGGSGSGGDGSGGDGSGGTGEKSGPRVVGYLPTYRSLEPANVNFDALTHLCIAFANPDSSGKTTFGVDRAKIDALVSAAHENNVKVLASIAGAAGGAEVAAQLTPDKRAAYVADLVAFVADYNLDGIDVDIEGHNINQYYEPFVAELAAALPSDQLLTAAVATWNGSDIVDAALAHYDFLNVMAYDHCGNWTQQSCDHSSLTDSLADVEYWRVDRGIPAERLVYGLPFYGYCWGAGCPASALTYSEILSQYPAEADSDRIIGSDYDISFNGRSTISAKVDASSAYSGVMIWELGQDASGGDSLLSLISEEIGE